MRGHLLCLSLLKFSRLDVSMFRISKLIIGRKSSWPSTLQILVLHPFGKASLCPVSPPCARPFCIKLLLIKLPGNENDFRLSYIASQRRILCAWPWERRLRASSLLPSPPPVQP